MNNPVMIEEDKPVPFQVPDVKPLTEPAEQPHKEPVTVPAEPEREKIPAGRALS